VSIKRLNYFTHQFLREHDFKDEQTYHREMRYRHNVSLHGWGVVQGLEVEKRGERGISVLPGIAIDKEGRELVLTESVTHEVIERDTETHIAIRYAEIWDEADRHSGGGVEGFTRVTESPEIIERRHAHADDAEVTLARIHINNVGHVHEIDMGPAVRNRIGGRGTGGWVRLPFKPARLYPLRIGNQLVPTDKAYEFIIDEYKAYCDDQGARGSMGIPVPPGATKIVDFRIAGFTSGIIKVHLFRTGWNLHENKPEDRKLLTETVKGPKFHQDISVKEGNLDESHAVAVSVEAEKAAEIWFIAARFE